EDHADDEPAPAEAPQGIHAEHGEEDELSAARLGEDRAHADETQGDEEDRLPRDAAPAVDEGEGERHRDAERERQLVRILERAAVAHATVVGVGAEEPDVLAEVVGAGLGHVGLAGVAVELLARAPVVDAEDTALAVVDLVAAVGRDALMDADRGEEETDPEDHPDDDLQHAEGLDAV